MRQPLTTTKRALFAAAAASALLTAWCAGLLFRPQPGEQWVVIRHDDPTCKGYRVAIKEVKGSRAVRIVVIRDQQELGPDTWPLQLFTGPFRTMKRHPINCPLVTT